MDKDEIGIRCFTRTLDSKGREPRKIFNLAVPESMLKYFKHRCEQNYVSMSAVLRECMVDYMKKN